MGAEYKKDTTDQESPLMKLIKKRKGYGFPTLACILIVIGISWLLICDALLPVIETAQSQINRIPETEIIDKNGKVSVHGHGTTQFLPNNPPNWGVGPDFHLNNGTIIRVSWESELSGLGSFFPAGDDVLPVNGYLFDEENMELFNNTATRTDAIPTFKDIAIFGEMIGRIPHKGIYFLVFENEEGYGEKDLNKDVTYWVTAVVPERVEYINSTELKQLHTSLKVPGSGILITGILALAWWVGVIIYIKKVKEK